MENHYTFMFPGHNHTTHAKSFKEAWERMLWAIQMGAVDAYTDELVGVIKETPTPTAGTSKVMIID
mgnify:CR=1 FL=1